MVLHKKLQKGYIKKFHHKHIVEEKEKKWFRILNKNEMVGILAELWETAGLEVDENRKDVSLYGTPILTTMQMLLLMYLTGSPGFYRLRGWESVEDQNSRFMMHVSKFFACFEKKEYVKDDEFSAGLLMIKI